MMSRTLYAAHLKIIAALFCLLTTFGLPHPLHAQDNVLVADVSEENVAITTGFHGTQLLLFGAISG